MVVFERRFHLLACSKLTGHRTELSVAIYNGPVDRGGFRNVHVAGDYVAFEDFSYDMYGTIFLIEVFNARLRTKRRVQTGQGPITQHGPAVGIGPTIRLVLTSQGAVAWTALDNFTPDPPTYEVWGSVRDMPMLLARGTDVEAHTLSLRKATVTWKQSGSVRRSRLAHARAGNGQVLLAGAPP